MQAKEGQSRERSGHSFQERLVLDLLQSGLTYSLEEIIDRLPTLSWSELFFAVDVLSRQGDIALQRKGFTYEVRHGHLDQQLVSDSVRIQDGATHFDRR